jgi:hypothetical protein
MPRHLLPLFTVLALLAVPALGAPPVLPTGIPYQGVLLDSGGQPQTGAVDLTVRIYDQILGGSLVYQEVFLGTPLVDGVFTIELGPSGSPTDTPTDPLTTSLTDALTADVGATGGGRYIEVQVGAATPQGRNPVLTVPFAMRSTSAASADTAGVATTALDTQSVAGLDATIFDEIWQHFDFDGGLPSSDPSQGLQDTDGDGEANFVDRDNDNDGLGDATELARGSDTNLVSPTLTAVAPTSGNAYLGHTLTLTGTNFEPGVTVQVGTESPAPQNVVPTSLDVDVVSTNVQAAVDVRVTRVNGETDLLPGAFTFDVPPNVAIPTPGVTLAVGGPLRLSAFGELLLASGDDGSFAVDTVLDGQVAFDASGGPLGQTVEGETTFDPTGGLVHFQVRNALLGLTSEMLHDADGDLVFEGPELDWTLKAGPQAPMRALGMDIDGTDTPAGGAILEVAGVSEVTVLQDRSGEGGIGGNEKVVIETIANAATGVGALRLDPAGAIAYVYADEAGGLLRMAWDRNLDYDFLDAPGGVSELFTVDAVSGVTCVGLDFDDAGRAALIYGGPALPVTLKRDLDGNGDFAGAGESTVVQPGQSGEGCDVVASGGGIAIAHSATGITLQVDRNDDGDFADATEIFGLSANGGPVAITRDGAAQEWLLSADGVYEDPVP